MQSKAGWVLFYSLLLVWVVNGFIRKARHDAAKEGSSPQQRDRSVFFFVVVWIVLIAAVTAAWFAFHGFRR